MSGKRAGRSPARLAPQPWMTAPATRAVLAALAAGGAEARFVGGCVRDALAGRPVKDVDIATPAPPERVIQLLRRARLEAVPTGIAHGTVMAIARGVPFEITTLRRDVETDGRRAKVAFTDDWTADAARRDLTINAIFCSPEGRLFDPFGGAADLAAGRIRFVGDAETRIREDVLRLLRFFRFYAHYGRPPPDAEALAAAGALAPLLPTLSGERVRAELLKLLEAPDPAGVLALMREAGVLAHLLPEAGGTAVLAALVAAEAAAPARLTGGADAIRRLAALLRPDPDAAGAAAARLRLSNAERDRLVDLVAARREGLPGPALDEPARRRLLYALGAARYRDRVLLGWAERLAAGEAALEPAPAWLALLALAADWQPPGFPLKGRDALAVGIAAGPALGRLLRAVEDWWIAGDFRADRALCLARLRELAAREARR